MLTKYYYKKNINICLKGIYWCDQHSLNLSNSIKKKLRIYFNNRMEKLIASHLRKKLMPMTHLSDLLKQLKRQIAKFFDLSRHSLQQFIALSVTSLG